MFGFRSQIRYFYFKNLLQLFFLRKTSGVGSVRGRFLPKTKTIARTIVAIVFFTLMSVYDVLGVDALVRENSQYLASRFLACFYDLTSIPIKKNTDGSPKPSNEALVALFTDSYLWDPNGSGIKDTENSYYPAPFANHAQFLKRIIKCRPSIVFYDLLFTPRQDNHGVQAFIREIKKAEKEGIPVLFAYNPEFARNEELYKAILQKRLVATRWSGHGIFYPRYSVFSTAAYDDFSVPLLHTVYANQLSSSENTLPQLLQPRPPLLQPPLPPLLLPTSPLLQTTPPLLLPRPSLSLPTPILLPTPAFHIKVILENKSDETNSDPPETGSAMLLYNNDMFVSWGADLPDNISLLERSVIALKHVINQEKELGSTTDKAKGIIPQISITQVNHHIINNQKKEDFLTGKAIFIGADITGIPDTINAPIGGPIPGVFLHAMAYDNLLRSEGDHWVDGEAAKILEIPVANHIFTLTLIVVIFLYKGYQTIEGRIWPTPASEDIYGVEAYYSVAATWKRFLLNSFFALFSLLIIFLTLYWTWNEMRWDSGNFLGMLSIAIPFYMFFEGLVELFISIINSILSYRSV